MFANGLMLRVSLLSFMVFGTVKATPVLYTYSGVVGAVTDLQDVLGDQVELGSPFEISVLYELATVPSSSTATQATYKDSVVAVSGSVGILDFAISPSDVTVYIYNNTFFDRDAFTISAPAILSQVPLSFNIHLRDDDGLAFHSNSLSDILSSNIPFDYFELSGATFGTDPAFINIGITLTQIIPEPSPFFLLSAVMVFVQFYRYRLTRRYGEL